MANLIERHAQKIIGVLSCFDRLVLQGTLPSVAYPQAVATELDRRGIRLFDYAKQFAAVSGCDSRSHRAPGGRAECGDRVHPAHQELPQGRSHSADPRGAWEPPGAGSHLLGHGAVPDVRAMARQEDGLHLHSPRSRQVPAQQLSDRMMVRQLHTLLDGVVARCLPDLASPRPLSLEHPASRVRHRHRLPKRRRPRSALRSPAPNVHSCSQGRRGRGRDRMQPCRTWLGASASSEPTTDSFGSLRGRANR